MKPISLPSLCGPVLLFLCCQLAYGHCVAGGTPAPVPGLGGGDTNEHRFLQQCLALPGTNVTITIDALADLGCNAFDAVHEPPQGQECPDECEDIPCCDTDPEDKYVTAMLNGHALDSSITGSSNMPDNGRFFEEWNYDCTGYAPACAEAGRSPCDGTSSIVPNRRIVTIPAETWNTWLGASGNTATIYVTSSAATNASLANYCADLGFRFCPYQQCDGPCGPDTYSRVSISFTKTDCETVADCGTAPVCQYYTCDAGLCNLHNQSYGYACTSDGNPCTNDICNGSGTCIHPNNNAPCSDGVFCNGTDTCSGGSCSAHSGSPCELDETCCERIDQCNVNCCNDADCVVTGLCDAPNDVCVECFDNEDCSNGLYCDGVETCVDTYCQPGPGDPCDLDLVCDEVEDECDCDDDGDCDDGLFCTGTETCASGDCQPGGDPCPGQMCDEQGDICVDCLDNNDCDDGLFCNGGETCVGGYCHGGPGDPCGSGYVCDEGGDTCLTDTDRDGVPDASDNCPTVSNADQANDDGDAIGDVCETIKYVDADSGATTPDGSSWAQAFRDVEQAIQAAADWNDIWVAAGTYRPQGTERTETFDLDVNVSIYGGFEGTETESPATFNLGSRDFQANETILSGDIHNTPADPTDNCYNVVRGGGTTSTTVLDGFTITGGNANVGSGTYQSRGAGMYNNGGSPRVRNCRFVANTAKEGGAVYNRNSSSPVLINCTFIENVATFDGGAVVNETSSFPTIVNCLFVGNAANGTGSDGRGGAMHNLSLGAHPSVVNCTFNGNTARVGGAIFNDASSPSMTNCVFSGNAAKRTNNGGGAIRNYNGAHPTLADCTLSGNTCQDPGQGGAVLSDASSSVIAANCIFWGNTAGTDPAQPSQIVGAASVTYSDVEGEWSGAGNINTDPLFVDANGPDNTFGTEDDDLRLTASSPCIDSARNADVPADSADLDCDGNTTEQVPRDLDGGPRFVEDLDIADCWQDSGTCGTLPVVDMGAYEYVPLPPTITGWRSVRNHGSAGNLSINLDPAASAGDSPTIETRRFGIQSIEVDFAYAAELAPVGIPVVDGKGNVYPPSSVELLNGGSLLRVSFSPGLPDETCYRIDLAGVVQAAVPAQGTSCDTGCVIRGLTGDINGNAPPYGDGKVDLTDMAKAKANAQSGVPLTEETCLFDVNIDGRIDLTDMALIKSLVPNGNSVRCRQNCAMAGGLGACGGGEMMMLGAGLFAELATGSTASILAGFVVHETGEGMVTLPPEGGTVVVDLVLGHEGDVRGFEVKVAVDAPDIVTVHAGDWTETANILCAYQPAGCELASRYDFALIDWYVVYADGSIVRGTGPGDLDDPDVTGVLSDALDLSGVDGAINTPAGELFASGASIGALLNDIAAPGETTVATLTLDIAGSPGTYHLTVTDAYATGAGESVPITPGAGLTITVQGP